MPQHHRKATEPSPNTKTPAEDQLMACITAILSSSSAALTVHRALQLILVSRRTTPPTLYAVSFHGHNGNEAEKFSIFTTLLPIVHYLQFTGQVVTKTQHILSVFSGGRNAARHRSCDGRHSSHFRGFVQHTRHRCGSKRLVQGRGKDYDDGRRNGGRDCRWPSSDFGQHPGGECRTAKEVQWVILV